MARAGALRPRYIVWREGWAALRLLVSECLGGLFDASRVAVVVSCGSRSGAAARIWGLPRVFSVAFGLEPVYVIEFIGERLAGLPPLRRLELLLHEVAHIPRGFSGGLVSHGRVFRERLERLRGMVASCRARGEVLRLLSSAPRCG